MRFNHVVRWLRRAFVTVVLLSLAACGGGAGGESTNTAKSVPLPSSGIYAWVLKPQGSISTPNFSLSLVHPDLPDVEFEVTPPNSSVSDIKVVYSGTVDASTSTVKDIKPDSLLYIVDNRVKRIPLLANGVHPRDQVKDAGFIAGCKFIFDGNDYAVPDNSQYIVSTQGTDRKCGTNDDGQYKILLHPGREITAKDFGGSYEEFRVIGMVRDPNTLAPFGWLEKSGFSDWPETHNVVLRVNNDPLLERVIIGDSNSLVYEYDDSLRVFKYSGPGKNLTLSFALSGPDSTLIIGTGWQGIGYDKNDFYIYRNSGINDSPTWSVFKINRTNLTTTKIGSGTGFIGNSSMGSTLLYLTIMDTNSNRLLTIDKNGGIPKTIESAPISTLTTVFTSHNGIHQLWRVTNIRGSVTDNQIEIIDELGNKVYSISGGVPLAIQPTSTLDLNTSENGVRFISAGGYGIHGFADAPLIVYDTATKTAVTPGVLPGSSDYGNSLVYASLGVMSGEHVTGFAGAIEPSNSVITKGKVFSFHTDTPNSIKYAPTTQ